MPKKIGDYFIVAKGPLSGRPVTIVGIADFYKTEEDERRQKEADDIQMKKPVGEKLFGTVGPTGRVYEARLSSGVLTKLIDTEIEP